MTTWTRFVLTMLMCLGSAAGGLAQGLPWTTAVEETCERPTYDSCMFNVEQCGSMHHQPKYQKGASQSLLHIPPGSAGPGYDTLACLADRAIDFLQQGCPSEGSTPGAFAGLAVSRAPRPAGPPSQANNGIEIELVDPSASFPNPAEWFPGCNMIKIRSDLDLSCPAVGPLTPEQEYLRVVLAHEIGHAFGLCHDNFCNTGQGKPSFMASGLDPFPLGYAVMPNHCAVVKRVNCAESGGGPGTPGGTAVETVGGAFQGGDCCLYCQVPPLRDLCDRLNLPIACGGPIAPPQGETCVHLVQQETFSGTIEITYPGGTHFEVFEITRSRSELVCFLDDPLGLVESGNTLAGTGPSVVVRSQEEGGAFGWTKVVGTARDDTYGIRDFAVWVDGNPVELADLQLGLSDPYTCNEDPAPDCDPLSRFEGYLNTQGLSDGEHTLQIVVTNDHPISPIPTYYETTFTVANHCQASHQPSASIVEPVDGACLTGVARIEAAASDVDGVDRVSFLANGSSIGLRFGPPYTLDWDTTTVPDGSYELRAGAVNRCGASYWSDPVTVTVGNQGCQDPPPPVVELTAPSEGAVLEGATVVTATATAGAGVEKVVFYIDGEFLRRDTEAPYEAYWDTTEVGDGTHTVQARVVDLAGESTWSEPVTVTTRNFQPVTLLFIPTDDTWVSQDEPDRAFGIYNYMRIRTIDGGHGRHAYLKFQVQGIEGTVVETKLRLRSQDQWILSPGVYRMTDHGWTENTLTWNNASLQHTGFWDGHGSWPADTWKDLDITGAVVGNGTYTFGMASPYPVGMMDFWSKESVLYVPVLEVTYVPAP